MQQFPQSVKRALAAIDFNNANTIGQTLENLDAMHLDKSRWVERNKQYYDEQKENDSGQNVAVRQIKVQSVSHRRDSGRYRGGRGSNNNTRDYLNTQYRNENVNREQMLLPDTRYPPPAMIENNNAGNSANTNASNFHLNRN